MNTKISGNNFMIYTSNVTEKSKYYKLIIHFWRTKQWFLKN